MKFSIRLTHREKQLAKSYAAQHSMPMGEVFKRALFEKIEDKYDIAIAEEAFQEFLEEPKTYSHKEVRELLDI